jgi:hypothetical protein
MQEGGEVDWVNYRHQRQNTETHQTCKQAKRTSATPHAFAKKSGGAPRPEAWIGKLRDINARLRSVLDDVYKIEDINDKLGDLRSHSLSEETQRAISNAYNTIEDKVQEIKVSSDAGTDATQAALRALSASAQ